MFIQLMDVQILPFLNHIFTSYALTTSMTLSLILEPMLPTPVRADISLMRTRTWKHSI